MRLIHFVGRSFIVEFRAVACTMPVVDQVTSEVGDSSARSLFSARLSQLWVAAGNPTLQRIADATEGRMRATRASGRGRGSLVQRMSDWRNGRSVPSRFETFEPVLVTLAQLAGGTSRSLPRELSSRSAWKDLWEAAIAEPTQLTVRTALRRDLDTFVGRDAEIGRILDVVGPGRVVSIHTVDGMPGVGKTALVTHVAHLLAKHYPDGQFCVELHTHTPGQLPAEPFDVLATLLIDTGIAADRIPDVVEARRDLWRNRVAGKRILLVLDDARDQAQIEPLLPTWPGCLTLVTSRRRLVALEGAVPLALGTLAPDAAVELFYLLAQRRPGGSGDAVVADIVRACGYLPLAIALLAGRLAHHPAWTLAELAMEFVHTRNRLGELDTGERAVRAAFTTSYCRLSPAQQSVFRRLALHPGLDIDAYAVAALNDIPLAIARRALEDLYTDHLIEESVFGRYRLHDLVHEYARHLVDEDPAEDRTRAVGRLLDYYQATAFSASRPQRRESLRGSASATSPDLSTTAAALAWMRTERSNLLACLQVAVSNEDLPRACSLTNALLGELRLHGPWQAAIFLNHRAVAAGQVGDLNFAGRSAQDFGSPTDLADNYSVAADLLQRMLKSHDPADNPELRAAALRALAVAQLQACDYANAADAAREVVEIHRRLGNGRAEASALDLLTWLTHLSGDYTASITLAHQAVALYRELGIRSGEVNALCSLGWVQCLTGNHDEAIGTLQQVVVMHRNASRPADLAFTQLLLACVHYAAVDLPGAIGQLEQSLALYREIGNSAGQGYILGFLASLQEWVGNLTTAIDLAELALGIHREIGNRPGQASTLNVLGKVRCELGEYRAAAEAAQQARVIYASIGNVGGESEALGNLGWAHHLEGDTATGVEQLNAALTLARAAHYPFAEIVTLNRLGAILAESDDYQRALATYSAALHLALRRPLLLEQARALEGTARCRAHLGDMAGARVDLRAAIGVYEEIGAPNAITAAGKLADLHPDGVSD
ncbi:tetratricopeptide repeat protein [Nocardia sp. NPDC059240]|uniref:tetratricopeptide repeat protein n=1 Tax=Nocardia sp. NPDC059240 TaxID=3346786 RepID=UPI00369931E7